MIPPSHRTGIHHLQHCDAISKGIQIRGYYADNGRYVKHRFREDCQNKSWTLNYCSVGAHHQNGIAKVKIEQLTLAARTMALHAQSCVPEYISTMLWPFALLAAANRINNLHIDVNERTPEMRFSKVLGATIRLKLYHTFGCPV